MPTQLERRPECRAARVLGSAGHRQGIVGGSSGLMMPKLCRRRRRQRRCTRLAAFGASPALPPSLSLSIFHPSLSPFLPPSLPPSFLAFLFSKFPASGCRSLTSRSSHPPFISLLRPSVPLRPYALIPPPLSILHFSDTGSSRKKRRFYCPIGTRMRHLPKPNPLSSLPRRCRLKNDEITKSKEKTRIPPSETSVPIPGLHLAFAASACASARSTSESAGCPRVATILQIFIVPRPTSTPSQLHTLHTIAATAAHSPELFEDGGEVGDGGAKVGNLPAKRVQSPDHLPCPDSDTGVGYWLAFLLGSTRMLIRIAMVLCRDAAHLPRMLLWPVGTTDDV